MMTIDTFIRESPGKGVGIFTVNAIAKGAVIWKQENSFTKYFSQKDVNELSKVQQEFIHKYAYTVPGKEDIWVLELDNGRFMNHSDEPNGEYDEHTGYAARDIAAGEELTCDYRKFDTQPLDFLTKK